MIKKKLCGSTVDEISQLIASSGYSFSKALLISNNIYKKRLSDFAQNPKIPKKLREDLISTADSGLFKPVASTTSVDNTVKYLFRNEVGLEYETVFLPGNKRNTVCVSTQAGCRMGCPFCVTGSYGFHGDLSAGEIINQIISLPEAGKITHVVFMGMGEPLDNLGNILKACQILTAEWGLAISCRNVTVSTVGITPGIEIFLRDCECNLTLSLHSPFSEERKSVVPVEKKYPVHEIIEIMRNYPVKKKRRLSIAYVMIHNVNDTDEHLEGLKALLHGSTIRINLLPYHPVRNDINVSSSDERMHFFKHNLVVSGISASIRKSRGADISAACGLLASGLKLV
jgi:23S rRNA (adenine2503-C2)-methyltransferase